MAVGLLIVFMMNVVLWSMNPKVIIHQNPQNISE